MASVNSDRYLAQLDQVQDEMIRLKRRGAATRSDYLHVLVPMIERMRDAGTLSADEVALMHRAVREGIEENLS